MFTKPLRHVVIVGLMGVGKTTVGRALGRELGWPLSDSDAEIISRHGATVRELNERFGTRGMHRFEAEHLLNALARDEPSVICAAASVVEDQTCCDALRAPAVFVVWLRGSVHLLVARFAMGPHRPILESDTGELFEGQLATRSERFDSVADLRISVDGRSVAEIVAEIRRALCRTAM